MKDFRITVFEEVKCKENTLSVNVFNKKKNKFEDSTDLEFKTFENAKKVFNALVGALINEKGFKKVYSFGTSDNYIEVENDVYHIQVSIYK